MSSRAHTHGGGVCDCEAKLEALGFDDPFGPCSPEEFQKRTEQYTAAGVPIFTTPTLGGCFVCQATSCADGSKLKVCSKCKVARYCGIEHQREHWKKEHKLQCKVLAKNKKARAGEPDFTKITILINKMNSRIAEDKHEEALKFIKEAHEVFKKDVYEKPLEHMRFGSGKDLAATMGVDIMDKMQSCYEALKQWDNMGDACKLGLQYSKPLNPSQSYACVAQVNMANWLYHHGPRNNKTFEKVLKHVKNADKHLRDPSGGGKNQQLMALRFQLELMALRSLERNFEAITPAEWLFLGCKMDNDFPFCMGEAAMELADILAWLTVQDKPNMKRPEMQTYRQRAIQMGTKALEVLERDQCCPLSRHNRAAAAVAESAVCLRRKGLANEYLAKLRSYAEQGCDPAALELVEKHYRKTFGKASKK